MAVPFDRRRQLELEAEAELELEQEMQAQQVARKPSPFAKPPENQLGADYNKGYGAQVGEALGETPKALGHMVKDAYNLAMPFDALAIGDEPSGLIDTVVNAGPDKVARTVGPLAAGTAGALSAAPFGAWGGPLGMALTGAAGFAGGMGLFDIIKDTGTQLVNDASKWGIELDPQKHFERHQPPNGPSKMITEGYGDIRPASEYAKDAIYNTTQAGFFNVLGAAAAKAPAIKKVAEPFTKEGAETRAAAELERLSPGIKAELETALQPKHAPGDPLDPFLQYKSLGEMLDSDVLKSAQRTLERKGLEEGGRASEIRGARNDAQLKWLDQIEQSPLTAADAQGAIKTSIDNTIAGKQAANDAAKMGVDEALSSLQSPITTVEAGGVIRGLADASKEAKLKDVSTKITDAGTGVVEIAPVKKIADELAPKYFREVGPQPNEGLVKLLEYLNREPEPSGLLSANKGPDGKFIPITKPATYTIQDIQAMRSMAIAIKGDKRSVAVATQIADALKKAESEAVKSGAVTPEELASLDAGRALRKEVGVDYESVATPTKSILSDQPYGEPKLPESAVPGKFVKSNGRGATEAIRNYKKTVGTDSATLEPLHRYVTDLFRDAAVKEGGLVDSAAANRWLNKHSEMLTELPDLRAQLSNVHTRQQFLNEKLGDLTRTRKEIERGALKALTDVDPEVMIPKMLSGGDMVKRTVSTVSYLKGKDKDAIPGLRRGVIDYLKTKTFIPEQVGGVQEAIAGGSQFKGNVAGGTLAGELQRIRPALERSKLFTRDQLTGFDQLYNDKRSQLSVDNAKAKGGSDTGQIVSTLEAMKRVAAGEFLDFMPFSPVIKKFVVPFLKNIPQAKFLAAFEEALLNPRYAREIMHRATAKNVQRTVQIVFKEEWDKAFGQASKMDTAGAVGKAAMRPPQEERKPAKPSIPKQQAVTARESFPDPKKLLRPPTPGKPVKVDLSQYSPKTRAQISVESSGNPAAVSSKGAQGLMQLMPDTAQDIAKSLGEPYMPLDPASPPMQQEASIKQNVRFGEHYRDVMLPKIDKAFKNKTLAMAAYNAGPERVKEAMRLAGTSRDVNKILSNLPKGVQKETIPYTEKIPDIIARLQRRG